MMTHRTSWSNPRVLSTLLLVFLSGAAAGALAYRQLVPHHTALISQDQHETLNKFQKELDLTPEQVGKLEIILDDYMKYMHDLQAQMDDVRAHGKGMVVKILNEEQRKKFDKLLAAAQGRPLR